MLFMVTACSRQVKRVPRQPEQRTARMASPGAVGAVLRAIGCAFPDGQCRRNTRPREPGERRGEGTTMEVQRVELPQAGAEKKKGGSKTLLYVLGGAAIVGAGVAAAMALGGGDGNGGGDDMVNVGVTVEW